MEEAERKREKSPDTGVIGLGSRVLRATGSSRRSEQILRDEGLLARLLARRTKYKESLPDPSARRRRNGEILARHPPPSLHFPYIFIGSLYTRTYITNSVNYTIVCIRNNLSSEALYFGALSKFPFPIRGAESVADALLDAR